MLQATGNQRTLPQATLALEIRGFSRRTERPVPTFPRQSTSKCRRERINREPLGRGPSEWRILPSRVGTEMATGCAHCRAFGMAGSGELTTWRLGPELTSEGVLEPDGGGLRARTCLGCPSAGASTRIAGTQASHLWQLASLGQHSLGAPTRYRRFLLQSTPSRMALANRWAFRFGRRLAYRLSLTFASAHPAR